MSTETSTDPRLTQLQPFFTQLRANIERYKALEAAVKAAEGDRDAVITAWVASTDDAEAKALREAISRAQAKLRALAEASVQNSELSPADKAKLKAEHEEATKKVKASSRALRGLAEPFGLDITSTLQEMGDPFLPKAPTGTGASVPRASVYVEVIKALGTSEEHRWNFDNLSSAAKHVESSGLDLVELQKLYAQAGGVAHEEIAKIKEPKEFTWKNPNLQNASHWTFRTTPKEGGQRGRQATATEQPKEEAA